MEELPGAFAALWLRVQPSECGWGLAGSNLGVLACIQIRLQTVEVLRASPLLTVQPLAALCRSSAAEALPCWPPAAPLLLRGH